MIRRATIHDVPRMQEIITSHAELGKMLFKGYAQLYETIRDFAVYESAGGRLPEAERAWRAVLEADELRHRTVLDAAGRWRSVRTWAIRELDQLRADGADIAELERAAADESDLDRRAECYPSAAATQSELLAAARKAESAGRSAEAVTRYRQLLGCLAGGDDKPIRGHRVLKTARVVASGLTAFIALVIIASIVLTLLKI